MGTEPFEIAVPDVKLEELRRRLEATNWPHDMANDEWNYGANGEYLRGLVDYWLHGYDWRAQERLINSFTHYKTEIDGVPLHFMREPGKGPNPIPLVMIHGWPWTFWDYHELIRPLADPASFGGDPNDSFEVIVVSMPGFGFSSPLVQPGMNAWRAADPIHRLMTEHLGFSRFGAHGGDWGATTTAQLGHKYPDSVIGIHLTSTPRLDHWNSQRPWDVTAGRMVSDDLPESTRIAHLDIQRRVASHVAVHMLDPQTLAYALHDSPVGLLAWLVERRRAWSANDGDVEQAFNRDFLLTTTSIYWFTDTFVTSARLYAEAGRNPWQPSHSHTPLVNVPTGVSYMRFDVSSRSSEAERQFDVRYTKEHPFGGHFAPAEEPRAVVDDIRAVFRLLR
ncbi:epoxide hydrolase 1 [Rhodococcus sp. 14C212]|uniref:epoxide hydrolase family protein n=1 Tax=Rhodococcus sp. 14C212 TaxID=2711209 RepID=UPI0013ED9FF4|nr:epoxide hydrolase [Rhodococcus sp. 14C212]NGP05873.1 epoxide hydrolase 1 [Rhodococcus sp. 14C212]